MTKMRFLYPTLIHQVQRNIASPRLWMMTPSLVISSDVYPSTNGPSVSSWLPCCMYREKGKPVDEQAVILLMLLWFRGSFKALHVIMSGYCSISSEHILGDGAGVLSEMYSQKTPYTEVKSVRASLSSFVVQIVCRELVREAKEVVKVENVVHGS